MDPMDKLSVLKKYFGHPSFRQGQEKLIDAILSGEDALGIMPTGGGKIRRVLELGLNTLSTYGLLKELPAEQVRAYVDRLEDEGYLRTNPDHLTLEPASSASAVLFGGQKISLSVRVEDKPKGAGKGKKTPEAAKTKLRFRCLRPWGAPTCFPPSRPCGSRSRRRRTCRPISSLPTQPLRIWPPKDPIPCFCIIFAFLKINTK